MARLVEYSDGTTKYEKRAKKACLDRVEGLYWDIGHLPTQDELQRKESKVCFTLSSIEDIFGSYQEMIEELLRRPKIASREEKRKEMGRPLKWTNEDMLDALYRANIDVCGSDVCRFITKKQYAYWRNNSSPSDPSDFMIAHRFGSWSEAIAAMKEWRASQEEDSTLESIMSELEETTSDAESEPARDATPEPEIDSASAATEAESVSTVESEPEPEIKEPESEPPDLAPDYWDLEFEMPSQADVLASEEQDSSIESEPDSSPAPVVEPELGTYVDVDPEPSNSEQEASGFTPMVYCVANLSSYDCRLGHTVLEPSDWSIVVEQSVTYTMTPLDKTKKDEGRKPSVNDADNRNIVPIGEYEKVIEWKLTLKDSMGHEVKWSELDSDVFYLVDAKIYGLLPQENRPANMVPVYQTLYSGSYPPGLYVCVE